MKHIKKYILLGIVALISSSCNDFLDTNPKDALSPNTTWKTEEDAQKFAIGCYDGWESGTTILYLDCTSDFGYNNFPWEGYTNIGNGTLTAINTGANFYNFSIIRRCNTFLENIDKIEFADEAVKKDLIAQVRVIRAYKYFIMNWWYGGVPIIENYNSAEEAKVARNTEAEVREFVENELDTYTKDLKKKPSELGRIAQGAALALRMRQALYYEDWATAKDRAQQIIDLGQYELEENYDDLFRVSGKSSDEIILAVQYIPVTRPLGVIGQMYNNGDGGWSSIVPTQNIIDTYEMASGLTKSEDNSGYDPTHHYSNRDPRMGMTVYYPGSDFTKEDGSVIVFNTLDKNIGKDSNPNFALAADNASKTSMTWAKYLDPITQYGATGIWRTEASPIVFRFAEVLLVLAEAENELNGPSEIVYSNLDKVRDRVGMPKVDRAKYATKEKVRELIRRERSVELAGEGLRRADILRWKTDSGKMVAEEVLNGVLQRPVGTVTQDASLDPTMRATINLQASDREKKVEERVFKPHNRYLPIPQGYRDSNPNLEQNEGY